MPQLGIDFGTSSTVAVLRGADGRVRPLLFDSSPLLASGVFATASGLLTGVDAERASIAHPAGLEANPKRRVDDGMVWLADREVEVTDLVVAVLDRVSAEARRVAGEPPSQVVLTHPAGWARARLGVLTGAATRAGLRDVSLVAEPVAAAAYFTTVLRREIPAGRCLVVYDLGAGTFDVSVVRPSTVAAGSGSTAGDPGTSGSGSAGSGSAGSDLAGYEVAGSAGIGDVGGLDLDAAVIGHARALTAQATDAWQRLDSPRTPADAQARYNLWRGARAAKEQLSRHVTADLHVPLVDREVRLNRDEFDRLARPYLDRTVQLTLTLLHDCGVPPAEVFLVGGSSRIPLAATLLHRALGIAPTVIDQPELVVAEGSLHLTPPATRAAASAGGASVTTAATAAGGHSAAAPATSTPSLSPSAGVPTGAASHAAASHGAVPHSALSPSRPPGRRRTTVLVAGAVVAVLAVALAAFLLQPDGATDRSSAATSPGATTSHPASPTAPTSAAAHAVVSTGKLLTGHTASVAAVAFSSDNSLAATGSHDNTIRLWDTATGDVDHTLAAHTDAVTGIAYSPDGHTLVSGSMDGTVRLWNTSTDETDKVLGTAGDGTVWCVAYSPDGKTIASGLNHTVKLWSSTGTALRALTGNSDDVAGVAFSPDSKSVVTAGADGTWRLWTVETGKQERSVTANGIGLSSVRFSHDGKTIATTGEDGSIQLWDTSTGKLLHTLAGKSNRGGAYAIAFSPDGATLAAGADDESVVLWNVGTGTKSTALTGFTETVMSVAFSPNGKMLIAGSVDGNARLWQLPKSN